MKVIKSIEVLEVDRQEVAVRSWDPNQPMVEVKSNLEELPYMEEARVIEELVQGRIFVNESGDRVCIGMTGEVQDVLGLPFGAYENMASTIDRLNKQIQDDDVRFEQLQTIFDSIQNSSVRARFVFLFKGIVDTFKKYLNR